MLCTASLDSQIPAAHLSAPCSLTARVSQRGDGMSVSWTALTRYVAATSGGMPRQVCRRGAVHSGTRGT